MPRHPSAGRGRWQEGVRVLGRPCRYVTPTLYPAILGPQGHRCPQRPPEIRPASRPPSPRGDQRPRRPRPRSAQSRGEHRQWHRGTAHFLRVPNPALDSLKTSNHRVHPRQVGCAPRSRRDPVRPRLGSAGDGTRIGVNSPRPVQAGQTLRVAVNRSVFTLSPGLLGISDGAITSQRTPRTPTADTAHNRSGPPHSTAHS